MHELEVRARATQATKDRWESRKWRLGHADCVRMTAWHLRQLGYRIKLPPCGTYRTVRGALLVLERLGHADVPAALDALGLERIAPAAAIVGDIIELPSTDPRLATLTVALGNGRVIGWLDDLPGGAAVLQPLDYVRAWRAVPRTKR